MTIEDLKDGESAIITDLDVDAQLKDRFFSVGICKSKKIKKLETSLGGSTILVELDRSCIILRAEEAKAIKVGNINE